MPSGPRQVLEHRITELSAELEALFENACDVARREQAEQLNQAVRRLRIAPDADELCATLVTPRRFADGSGAIPFNGPLAGGQRAHQRTADRSAGAGCRGGDSQDPVIAAATPTEVSAALVELFGTRRIRGYRSSRWTSNGERVAALVYCWGSVQMAAVELLAQAASAVWSAIPVPAPQLVSIAPAPELPPIAPAGDEAQARIGVGGI